MQGPECQGWPRQPTLIHRFHSNFVVHEYGASQPAVTIQVWKLGTPGTDCEDYGPKPEWHIAIGILFAAGQRPHIDRGSHMLAQLVASGQLRKHKSRNVVFLIVGKHRNCACI